MIQALLAAVGLMLVIEGIMPFLNPNAFRTNDAAAPRKWMIALCAPWV